MIIKSESLAQKKARCSVAVWSLTYLFLFLLFGFMIASSIKYGFASKPFTEKFHFFVSTSPVLAMPLSLGLMWFAYSKGYYRIIHICCAIPIFFFVLSLLIDAIPPSQP
jgi:hypothetical protein